MAAGPTQEQIWFGAAPGRGLCGDAALLDCALPATRARPQGRESLLLALRRAASVPRKTKEKTSHGFSRTGVQWHERCYLFCTGERRPNTHRLWIGN